MSRTEQVATKALDLALAILHEGAGGERVYKTDRDFATTADYAIEDAVREYLAVETPEIGFLGEERGHSGSGDNYWCLDPIDGTTNFTRGVPNYGVSLALIGDTKPVYGTIALPAHGERYVGQGGLARLNRAPISVASTASLRDALVSVGDFATGAHGRSKNRRRLKMLSQLADSVGRVRMLGSAATDLAWLAAGRLDAVVIDANRPWDVAAGIALARAAGAVVSHVDGSPWGLEGRDLLAAVPHLHESMVDVLAK